MPVFRTRSVKTTLAAAFAAFVYLGMSAAFMATAQAQPETVTNNEQRTTSNFMAFDIPAQPLSEALSEFARQSGQQLLYSPDVTEGRISTAIQGDFRPDTALDRLLQGTEQGFAYTPSGAILVGDPTEIQRRISQMNGTSQAPGQNTIGQRRPGIEEIIVTGQKRAERIQDVPIAISAFTAEDLEAQKIEGGFDLLKGVPNVTFSKTNFSGYNFQIRGIGTQAVSATTDPGVAVSFNNTTLIVNRLFEQEYLDVERVEVLRGPQGTLFGRNATGGVINVITNKPELGVWDGMFDVEVGSYNTRRLRGFFNAPIGDDFAIRGAYASTIRDGYGINRAAEDADVSPDVDNRDLWTGRLSLGWQPSDRFRMDLIWERFEEDDNRVRTSKQLCHRDDSPTEFRGVTVPDEFTSGIGVISITAVDRAAFSQGCEGGSLYSDDAFGTVNGASVPFISGLYFAQSLAALGSFVTAGSDRVDHQQYAAGPSPYEFGSADPNSAPCPAAVDGGSQEQLTYSFDICQSDPYGGQKQSSNLREIYSLIEPQYEANSDIVELSFDFEWNDYLTLSSQTVYAKDEYYATQDYNRYATFPIWNGDGARNACGRTVINGKEEIDCTEPGEELITDGFFGPTPTGSFYSGRGTYIPITDADGDGVIDQGVSFGTVSEHGFTVDNEGYIRNPEDSNNRVGYYNHMLNNGAPNTYCDPQLGCSDKLVVQDLSRAESTQWNQELRLVSSFPGNWNFSLGANYTNFETFNDYFVFSNAFSHLMQFWPFQEPFSECPAGTDDQFQSPSPAGTDHTRFCRYIDPNPLAEIDGEGHNYFRSANPYELNSAAIFGELYWNATDTVKVTLGARLNWDRKVFTPIPSQLLLADYRDLGFVSEGDPPPANNICLANPPQCAFTGTAENGRGAPTLPDIVQEWTEPTGRLVVDWQPDLATGLGWNWVDETLVYGSVARGYKGGGANPPTVSPPSGNILAQSSGATAPATFEPEYINAFELGTKNTLFGGALTLNVTGFYYDYKDYQISKIVDRTAVNENFDAEVWGLEFESVFAPTLDWQFNAAIGYLQTKVDEGEKSIDLMDRAQGGNQVFRTTIPNEAYDPDLAPGDPGYVEGLNGSDQEFIAYDDWTVVKPWVVAASNCVAPTEIIEAYWDTVVQFGQKPFQLIGMCPVGGLLGTGGGAASFNVSYYDSDGNLVPWGGSTLPVARSERSYSPPADAPNTAAGFFADLGGNELPNAPHFTVALGGQYSFDLTRDWRATARVDYYWQDESYARIYNTEYDRLKDWSNTNVSFWVNNPVNGITVEAYVKNLFDETPITGTFLNSDDSGLTTNVFTLDPRLIGVSLRKEF